MAPVFLATAALAVTAGCGGGGEAVTLEEREQAVTMFEAEQETLYGFSAVDQVLYPATDLYPYIPIGNQLVGRQVVGQTFTDDYGNVWTYTALNPDGSGSAETTYLWGEPTGEWQATLSWSSPQTDPQGNFLGWFEWSAADGSHIRQDLVSTPDGYSWTASGHSIDPVTAVTYDFSVNISASGTGGAIFSLDVDASNGTSLAAEFIISPDETALMALVTYTDPTGYWITLNATVHPLDWNIVFTAYDSHLYSGELTLNPGGSGTGEIRDPSGAELCDITLAPGRQAATATLTFRDQSVETVSADTLKRAQDRIELTHG